MEAWAYVASQYVEFNLLPQTVSLLVERNVLASSFLLEGGNSHPTAQSELEMRCGVLSLQILNRILIPYLQDPPDN